MCYTGESKKVIEVHRVTIIALRCENSPTRTKAAVRSYFADARVRHFCYIGGPFTFPFPVQVFKKEILITNIFQLMHTHGVKLLGAVITTELQIGSLSR